MDRLTYKHDDNWCISGLNGKLIGDKYANYWGEAINRLAAYEDAEEQGRLIILPAKTVFVVEWDAGEDCDMRCPQVDCDDYPCDICPKGRQFVYERKCKEENINYIGRTVFLTREEAEATIRT